MVLGNCIHMFLPYFGPHHDFMASSQQRQLSKLIGSHKSTHVKFTTGANNYIRLNIAQELGQLAADLVAKGLLNLMTSSPVATGLAHLYS